MKLRWRHQACFVMDNMWKCFPVTSHNRCSSPINCLIDRFTRMKERSSALTSIVHSDTLYWPTGPSPEGRKVGSQEGSAYQLMGCTKKPNLPGVDGRWTQGFAQLWPVDTHFPSVKPWGLVSGPPTVLLAFLRGKPGTFAYETSKDTNERQRLLSYILFCINQGFKLCDTTVEKLFMVTIGLNLRCDQHRKGEMEGRKEAWVCEEAG